MYCTRFRFIFTLLLFLCVRYVQSQNNTVAYWEPEVALNYKVTPLLKQNFSLSNRNYTYHNNKSQLTVRKIEITHFSSLTIDPYKSIGLGVQYRFREVFENDKENELRLTQQFNITKITNSVRFGNRFRIEQRIQPSTLIHRFRYRFAIDIPLKGLRTDIGEPYLVATTESLLSIEKSAKAMYDQRITSQIGWSISNHLKAQLGVQFRMENYTENTEHVFLFLNSIVFSL
ncbi:DUF2490 domain-containing protein [Maribacter litoralis]|uniref:DUF2490 domain-containing protein n=1 Tax=Maribacter litoralis TaxID=2059726 RepID=A0A653PWH7_9FLAO|nr:DUF2490 domain-containing protein [Maribacter litoralis]VXB33993.1 conserved exported hypothetical protein [Maribacter litoralis]